MKSDYIKLKEKLEEAKYTIRYMTDILDDYDGYKSAEKLKELIDEVYEIGNEYLKDMKVHYPTIEERTKVENKIKFIEIHTNECEYCVDNMNEVKCLFWEEDTQEIYINGNMLRTVVVGDNKYRMAVPINYCPKCGRKLEGEK